jgi:hypothetical protein
MRITWVNRNRRKIGARMVTDSRTPRRFRTTSTAMATNSIGSFQPCSAGGRKLKMASAPAAIEVVMVRT